MMRPALCLALAVTASATEPAGTLTLEEALRTAERRQPALRQARAGTQAADARVRIARAPLLPQLSGNLSYQRTTANFAPRPSFVPITSARPPPSFQTFNFFSAGVTLSQLVYDFGQSWGQLRSAEADLEAQRGVQGATELQTRLDVRAAFFAARAQKSLVEVARSNFQNQERHLRQVQGFVEVGSRPQIDLAQTRTDRANARAQLINAVNNYEVSKARLNQVMGVERSTAYDVAEEMMPPVPDEDAEVDRLIETAYRARPELEAQGQVIRSSEALVGAARSGYFPSLGLSTTFNDVGTSPRSSAWNWNAQAQLTWNLFDGLGTPARTAQAQANLASAQAQLDAQRLQVRLEVEQQRWAVRAAKEGLAAAIEAEAAAKERLSLAEGRYETGVGNVIELGDSQVAFTAAAAQRVQAEYNLASARAGLLKALGLP